MKYINGKAILLINIFLIMGVSILQAQYKGFNKTSSEEELLKGLKVKNRRVSSDALDVLTPRAVSTPITNPQILSAINEFTTSQIDYQIHERAKVFLVLNGNNSLKDKRETLITYAQTRNYLLKKLSIMNLGKIGTSDDIPFLESKLTDKSMGVEDVDEPPFGPVSEWATASMDQIKMRALPSSQQVDFLIKRFMEDPNNYPRRQIIVDFGDLIALPLTEKLVELFQRDFLQNSRRMGVYTDFPKKDLMLDVMPILESMDISNSEATKLLIPFVHHQQDLIKIHAIAILGCIGTKEAIPELEKVPKVDNKKDYAYWIYSSAQQAISSIHARENGNK